MTCILSTGETPQKAGIKITVSYILSIVLASIQPNGESSVYTCSSQDCTGHSVYCSDLISVEKKNGELHGSTSYPPQLTWFTNAHTYTHNFFFTSLHGCYAIYAGMTITVMYIFFVHAIDNLHCMPRWGWRLPSQSARPQRPPSSCSPGGGAPWRQDPAGQRSARCRSPGRSSGTRTQSDLHADRRKKNCYDMWCTPVVLKTLFFLFNIHKFFFCL